MTKFAKIIPRKKMPKKLGLFDYEIPDALHNLTVGDLVRINFRNSEILGLLAELTNQPEIDQDKKIKEIIAPDNFWQKINPFQLTMINWFAEYYSYPLSSTFALFYPEITKKSAKFSDKFIWSANNIKPHRLEESFFAEFALSKAQFFLLFARDREKKLALYLKFIQNSLARNEQLLLLFATVETMLEFCQNIPVDWHQDCAILSTDQKHGKNQHNSLWREIKNNKKKIIIGTRSAVFAPFATLKTIIIDSAHGDDYKQWDQDPRYDAVEVCQKLGELFGAKLIYSSLSPKICHLTKMPHEQTKVIKLGTNLVKTEIIDLRHERKKDYFFLSERLLNIIKENLTQKNKILLIANKAGEAGQLVCHDCGFLPICPDCHLPMTVNEKELRCFRCGQSQDIFLSCPKCGSTDLRAFGIGALGLKKQLEKLLSISIELVPNGQKPKTDFCLIDHVPADLCGWPKFSMVCFLYFDNLLNLPDFSANEKVFCAIANVCAQNGHNQNWSLILQTNYADNQIFKYLPNDYFSFYKNELQIRQDLGYPPNKFLLKIFFDHHDETVAQKEAHDLYQKINRLSEEKNFSDFAFCRMEGPYLHYRRKVRQRFRQQLALFFDDEKKMQNFLNLDLVPRYWRIDRNPLNLL
ncbi:MAG: hypothetical protein WCT18_00480 [Patescibacteria group bacterium]